MTQAQHASRKDPHWKAYVQSRIDQHCLTAPKGSFCDSWVPGEQVTPKQLEHAVEGRLRDLESVVSTFQPDRRAENSGISRVLGLCRDVARSNPALKATLDSLSLLKVINRAHEALSVKLPDGAEVVVAPGWTAIDDHELGLTGPGSTTPSFAQANVSTLR